MTISPEDLVRREVHYCVSYLVSTLAAHYGATDGQNELGKMTEQAWELACPIDDWEEAAFQAGWTRRVDGMFVNNGYIIEGDDGSTCLDPHGYGDWQTLCEDCGIEPYQREVFEHWIVSDWLADKLAAHDEKVDKDFAGMIVWARTTTGQGIASDSVIEAICAELNAA